MTICSFGKRVLRFVKAGVVLTICTIAAAILCAVVTQTGGTTAAYAALAIGLFNSIMFPTIFTLTLERSTAPTSATSGLLVFGIIGGAVLPPIAGQIADNSATLNPVFYVPLIGYLLLVGFALAASRARVRNAAAAGGPAGH